MTETTTMEEANPLHARFMEIREKLAGAESLASTEDGRAAVSMLAAAVDAAIMQAGIHLNAFSADAQALGLDLDPQVSGYDETRGDEV